MSDAFNPNWTTHPGDHLQEYLEIRGWSQAEFARRAKMTPKHVSEIINHKAPLTAPYALRFSKVLKPCMKPEMWMALQASYDLFHARKKTKP
jgi:HTH-type transcriptional regulator/antitoxin HigA